MKNSGVNRSLSDPDLDDVDHALGRPRRPMAPTYRDHYAVDAGSEQELRMLSSPYWRRGRSLPSELTGGLTVLHVTEAGRRALQAHLDVRKKS